MKTNLKKVFALIFAVMFVFCFAACGEKKAPVIGISQYGEHESLDNCREGFLQGLKDAGLVEGTDYTIDYQNAGFDDNITKQIAGTTLDEQAASLGSEVADFDGVTFGAFYVNGPGVEPRLVGAIASTTEKGVLSAPVKGMSGVYVFQVDDIQTSDKQTAEGERVRAQAMAESMAQQFSVQAIQQMANIQDLRGEYF